MAAPDLGRRERGKMYSLRRVAIISAVLALLVTCGGVPAYADLPVSSVSESVGPVQTGAEVAAVSDEDWVETPDDPTYPVEGMESGTPGIEAIPGVTDQPGYTVTDAGDATDPGDVEPQPYDTQIAVSNDVSQVLAAEHVDNTGPQNDGQVEIASTLTDAANTTLTPSQEDSLTQIRDRACRTFRTGGLPTQIRPCATTATSAEAAAARSAAQANLATDAARTVKDLGDASATAQQNLVIPNWCIVTTTKWLTRRFEACYNRMMTARLLQVTQVSISVIATVTYGEYRYLKLSPNGKTWSYNIVLSMGTMSGDYPGIYVSAYSFYCSNSCVPHWQGQINKFDSYPKVVKFATSVEAKAAQGKRRSMTGDFSYSFVKAGAYPGDPISVKSHNVRCDRAMPGSTSIGCVVPSVVPVMTYSRTGAYPQLARHIYDAQQSGLPGPYPSKRAGDYLTRLTDKTKVGKNRTRSCPSSLKRPSGKSCDEYPFASSYQGPYTARNTNPRTFAYCSLPEDTDTGPNGYSRCMISASQNSQGGSALSVFFGFGSTGNRVLAGDAYRVRIS